MSHLLKNIVILCAVMGLANSAIAEPKDGAEHAKKAAKHESKKQHYEDHDFDEDDARDGIDKKAKHHDMSKEQRRAFHEQKKQEHKERHDKPSGLVKQQEMKANQERKELDKGSEQGKAARQQHSKKWWKFWE